MDTNERTDGNRVCAASPTNDMGLSRWSIHFLVLLVILSVSIENIYKAILELPSQGNSDVKKVDATERSELKNVILSTDPPYYDNIGYADLSDFFYIWIRHSLLKVYPELFTTLLVPKAQELVATPFRFNGDRQKADEFFENGLRQVFYLMRSAARRNVSANYTLGVAVLG